MEIDLESLGIFNNKTLSLNNKINFIFGKNGTGKSTLSSAITKQCLDKDVRIFQGINSVIAEGRLNSITLGKENNIAERKIQNFEKDIENINVNKNILSNQSEIIYKKTSEINHTIRRKESNIKKFLSKSASEIKNNKFHIAHTSYNMRDFVNEIKYAFHLSEDDKKVCQEYLKIEEKNATKIILPKIDFEKIFKSANEILTNKVEKEKEILRLSSESKIRFAELGWETHEKGDICAFCGNPILDSAYDEIDSYFSGSKIIQFQEKIDIMIDEIDYAIVKLSEVTIDKNNFYNKYQDEVDLLNYEWNILEKEVITFLNNLKNELHSKYSNLFKPSMSLDIIIPNSFESIITKFNNLVVANNSEDISRFKKFSRDLLRFDLIFTYIENFKLNSMYDEIEILKVQKADLISLTEENNNKIKDLDIEINLILVKIQEEVELTKSEKILATNINKKLNLYVSFQLEHFEIDSKSHKGYYRIKNKDNFEEEYREIETLSEGEKNIIGFLYFIEKLSEISDHQKDKIIIFDDPMDSNDEMMQYIIITEIQELMKSIDNGSSKDILIIMTHNAHFYINIKYNRLYIDGQDRYGRERKSDQFIRLEKCNNRTNIKIINSEGEDFATSYELLWKELYFLYNNNKPELMLNSIRRIIETFMKFNKKYDFYNNQREAQKLFNVNSHSLDDLEADINGKSREQLYNLMKECFNSNGYSDHFKLHWKQAKK